MKQRRAPPRYQRGLLAEAVELLVAEWGAGPDWLPWHSLLLPPQGGPRCNPVGKPPHCSDWIGLDWIGLGSNDRSFLFSFLSLFCFAGRATGST